MASARTRLLAAGFLALAASATTACEHGGGGGGKDASGLGKSVAGPVKACTPPATLPSAQADPLLPKGLTLPPDAIVLQAEEQAAQRVVGVATSKTVSEVRALYEAQVAAAGYPITKTDDEGREAEVHFKVDGKAAVVGVARASCPPAPTRFSISVAR